MASGKTYREVAFITKIENISIERGVDDNLVLPLAKQVGLKTASRWISMFGRTPSPGFPKTAALICTNYVPSLELWHCVFWDGRRIIDPQPKQKRAKRVRYHSYLALPRVPVNLRH